MTRLVDVRTDQFVEDLAALDPLTATFAGIAGHDAVQMAALTDVASGRDLLLEGRPGGRERHVEVPQLAGGVAGGHSHTA